MTNYVKQPRRKDNEKIKTLDGKVEPIFAYAICDNDGGRKHKPKPLCGHIYSTAEQAKQNRDYRQFDPQFYPIRRVLIKHED